MNRRPLIATAGSTAVIGLAGCLDILNDGNQQVNEDQISESITFEDREFDPLITNIGVNEAVEWHNATDRPLELRTNTTPGDAEDWDMSADVDPDGTYAHQFQSEGIYSYHDIVQTEFNSCGVILVGEYAEEDVDNLLCQQ